MKERLEAGEKDVQRPLFPGGYVVLIRHGKTAGNLEGRYIGARTDEPLCEVGIQALQASAAAGIYPGAKRLFASPMQRCLQTAQLLYPQLTARTVQDFRECDFGLFEGKNYAELNGRADYQAWIDSGGELPFPGGESRRAFAERCAAAFSACLASLPEETHACDGKAEAAFVMHGGSIMAVMEAFALPPRDYFDWQCPCASGYLLRSDGSWSRIGT